MTSDERNFRSIYYEKVGFKNVEEKKSLEMLLNEKPLDRGVIPMQVDCHHFVMSQRKQEYKDLYHTLLVTKIIDDKTPKSQVFLAMWLIQTGNLTFDLSLIQDKNFSISSFVALVTCLMHFFEDETDTFWIARKFYDNIFRIQDDFPTLVEVTHNIIEREDPEFYQTLMQNSVLKNLPLTKWFGCCFAGIFNQVCIIRIWDKVCGGSYKILAYFVSVLLTTLKHQIIKMNDPVSITQCIKHIPKETADIIVHKTIDIWQQSGSPLTLHDKPKTS